MDVLIAFAIRNRWFIVAIAIVALLGGLMMLSRVRLDVFPEFVAPQISVQTEAPGWTAEQVELRVTAPLEAALAGTMGIATLRSDSIDGLSVINLEIDAANDPYRVRQGVAERLAEVAAILPAGVASPKASPLTSSTMDVLKFGLQSTRLDRFELRDIATWELKPRLLAIPGVARVTVFGGAIRQWQIQLDPNRLDASGLSVRNVIDSLRTALQLQGGGTLELDAQRLPIVLVDSRSPVASLENLVLGADARGPLFLRDIAQVVAGEATPIGDALIQGQPGVLLTVSGQYGSNTLQVTRDIEAAIAGMQDSLTQRGVTLVSPLHRPANFIERSLGELSDALLLGSVLILGTLFLFLKNWRAVVISFVTIPLAMLMTVSVLHLLGQTINTLTIGGLAVALGLLVDDAIVDLENVIRRLQSRAREVSGRAVSEIIREASQEVRSPVFLATIVVLLAFLPVLALSGVQGRLLAPMALAFVISVAASLLVALTVTPALCALLLTSPKTDVEASWWSAIVSFHWQTMTWVDRRFKVMIAAVVMAMVVAACLLPRLQSEFFPMFREGHFVVQVFAKHPGTSLAEMRRVGRAISKELLALPYIATVEQQIGRAELGEDTWAPSRSEFHIELKANAEVDQATVQRELRHLLARYPGVQTEVMTFLGDRISETMTGETSAVVISIFGTDLDVLDLLAQQVGHEAGAVSGVVDLKLGATFAAPAYSVSIDPLQPERLGVNAADIADVVSAAYNGVVVGQLQAAARSVDVALAFPPEYRSRPESIDGLPVWTHEGPPVHVRDVATVRPTQARPSIQHEAGRRRSVVAFNVSGRSVQSAVQELKERLVAKVHLPLGTSFEIGGVADAERRAQLELQAYSLLAIVLIVISLVLSFGRFFEAFIVLLNVPAALIGSIAVIAITGIGLSIGSLVGLVTVFGISARNAILMLKHYEHLHTVEQQSWGQQLLWRGASERLRPVLMTALLTALGLVPLAAGMGQPGHEIEAPMAITVLGGLLSSTILTLCLLPSLAKRLVQRANTRKS